MKKMMALLLAMMFCLTLTGTVSAESAKIITMGTNASFAPFEYIGDDGKPTGFDIAIAKEIAKDMGAELVVEDMAFDGLLAAMSVGKIDFVIAAMTITDERKQQAAFSDAYYQDTQKVIVKKGYEGIKSIEDLKDKAIAVQDGTTGFLMASDELGIPASKLASFKSSPDTVMELMAGRVDCILIDNGPAQFFVSQNEEITILDGLEMPVEEYGIAVELENKELLASINATLKRIMEDGTYEALVNEYFAATK
ncbi:MAG: basic amino acid ABC transporter substrate-binding protein [Clostridia bacterium]